MGYSGKVFIRKDMIMDINESNAPHTREELEAVENIVKVIKMCTANTLNNEQKQLIRDAHASTKGENENQPEWSSTNYLKLIVESFFAHGVAIGKSRQLRLTQKDLSELVKKSI